MKTFHANYATRLRKREIDNFVKGRVDEFVFRETRTVGGTTSYVLVDRETSRRITILFLALLLLLPFVLSLLLFFFFLGRLKAVLDFLPFPQMHVGGCRRGGWGWGWSTPFPDSDNC